MINKNTTFILGAGASKPYAYPTGWELKDEIIKNFLTHCKRFESIPHQQKQSFDTVAPEFIENLMQSNSDTSIDLFLSRNPQFKDIGKIAIAVILVLSELRGTFRGWSWDSDADWFSFLFTEMAKELTKPRDYKRFKENKVNFITFNYDRVLEHLLYNRFINEFTESTRIQNSDPSNFEELPFKIIHVYGLLSKLPWQERSRYNYLGGANPQSLNPNSKKLLNFPMIKDMAGNIKIINEREDNPEIKEAKQLIKNSERVFFLGFGFAQENLEILDLPATLNSSREIYGTALGMTQKEIGYIINFIRMQGIEAGLPRLVSCTIKIREMDCRQLLREYL
ncbi:MAG: hypothetical protein GY874_18105 [Desulfobacteraceae bacterium]|nr:hypothetical protein [Desulfobacteraceae bacterium]